AATSARDTPELPSLRFLADRTTRVYPSRMSQPPPSDAASPPPADARPGDTWGLDTPSTPRSGDATPAPPAEPPLPVVQAELTDVGAPPPGPPPRRSFRALAIAPAAALSVVGAAA